MIALAEEVGADASKLQGSLALLMEAIRTGVENPMTIGQMSELDNLSNGLTAEESSLARSKKDQTVDVDEVLEDRHVIMEGFGAKTMPEAIVKAIEVGALIIKPKVEEEAPDLKPKHVEVLTLVARGYSPSGIAKELEIHRNTVTNRLNRARKLLGAKDLNHAMRRAYETGWFTPTDEQQERLYAIRIGAGLILSGMSSPSGQRLSGNGSVEPIPMASVIPIR